MPRPGKVELRLERLGELIGQADPAIRHSFQESLKISWIYHDSALEGVVYSFHELKAAIDNQVVSDTSLIPVYDEIRQQNAAIELIKELATRKRLPYNLDLIKRIYATLAPEEAEGKGPPRYRKDMPLHRLYFHQIAAPEKISYRMRQLVEWMASPSAKKNTHPIRFAAQAHHKLLQIYPFPKHSGRVARLLMNLMLLRAGYSAAIVHATERQRYYDALRTSPNAVANIVQEALMTSLGSAIRYFETDGGRTEDLPSGQWAV